MNYKQTEKWIDSPLELTFNQALAHGSGCISRCLEMDERSAPATFARMRLYQIIPDNDIEQAERAHKRRMAELRSALAALTEAAKPPLPILPDIA